VSEFDSITSRRDPEGPGGRRLSVKSGEDAIQKILFDFAMSSLPPSFITFNH